MSKEFIEVGKKGPCEMQKVLKLLLRMSQHVFSPNYATTLVVNINSNKLYKYKNIHWLSMRRTDCKIIAVGSWKRQQIWCQSPWGDPTFQLELIRIHSNWACNETMENNVCELVRSHRSISLNKSFENSNIILFNNSLENPNYIIIFSPAWKKLIINNITLVLLLFIII